MVAVGRCAVIGILLATLTSHAFAQAQPICNALANANNQLYLVAADGSLSAQLPADTQSKSSISLAPDGSKVAYISAANPDAFTVADTAGHVAVFPVQKSHQGPFVGVSWESADVVKVRYHVGPHNEVFRFFKVPPDFSASLHGIRNPIAGLDCATQSGDDGPIACLSENKLVVGRKILLEQDPLAASNVNVLMSAKISLGTIFTTQTSPSFQVRLISLSDGVTLRVTLPDGTWSQSRVPVGSTLPVNWEDNLYGIVPASVNAAKGQATVRLVVNNGVSESFDPTIAWSRNNHVALVAHGAKGTQLYLVRPSGNQAPMVAGLGAMEQVTSISYDTSTLLMMQTRTSFRAVQINKVDGNSRALQIVAVTTLPAALNVALPGGITSASVEGWACH